MSIKLKLKKSQFSRNRHREQEHGSFFRNSSSRLSKLVNIIISAFLTPAMITTSLLSTESFFIFANLFLSLGYLTNFIYRALNHHISKIELAFTTLALITVVAAAHLFLPATVGLTFVGAMTYTNFIATTVNSFFLLRPLIIPPFKSLIETIATKIGFDVQGNYFYKPPLTLSRDRFALDRLLRNTYGYDSSSDQFKESDIQPFNNTLQKMTEYMNKYGEEPLGYVRYQDNITNLENAIQQLLVEGNDGSCKAFINKKLDYKQTKLSLLKQAKREVKRVKRSEDKTDHQWMRFFHNHPLRKLHSNQDYLQAAVRKLEHEIERQSDKMASLEKCLS